MKTTGLIASALMAMALPALAAEPQVGTGETDGYKLVWQDLFDGTSLNLDRWNIEVNGDGGGNNELQYYTARLDNVRVGDDGETESNALPDASRRRTKSHSSMVK